MNHNTNIMKRVHYNYKTKNSTEKIETKNHYFRMKKFTDDFVKIVSDSDCQTNFLALIYIN